LVQVGLVPTDFIEDFFELAVGMAPDQDLLLFADPNGQAVVLIGMGGTTGAPLVTAELNIVELEQKIFDVLESGPELPTRQLSELQRRRDRWCFRSAFVIEHVQCLPL